MKIQRAAEKEGVAPREDAVELHKLPVSKIYDKSKGVIIHKR